MRKALRLLAVAAVIGSTLIVAAPPAAAHGSCNNVSLKPDRVPVGLVQFAGFIDCTNQEQIISIIVEAGKRPGNDTGAFNWFDLDQVTDHNNDNLALGFTRNYDCDKDYRTRISTFAITDQDEHGVDNKVSNILDSQC